MSLLYGRSFIFVQNSERSNEIFLRFDEKHPESKENAGIALFHFLLEFLEDTQNEELVKKVCSFLDEDVLLVTSGLLWGNRWNVKAWISSKEHVSDHVEFSVPPEYIDVAKTIIAFDMVLNVCLPSRLSLLLCDDF